MGRTAPGGAQRRYAADARNGIRAPEFPGIGSRSAVDRLFLAVRKGPAVHHLRKPGKDHMSKLAGIFCFGDQVVAPADESRIRKSLVDLEECPPGLIRSPGVLFGHAPPVWAGRRVRQCATSPEGLVCTWDGRLDNSGQLPVPTRAGVNEQFYDC